MALIQTTPTPDVAVGHLSPLKIGFKRIDLYVTGMVKIDKTDHEFNDYVADDILPYLEDGFDADEGITLLTVSLTPGGDPANLDMFGRGTWPTLLLPDNKTVKRQVFKAEGDPGKLIMLPDPNLATIDGINYLEGHYVEYEIRDVWASYDLFEKTFRQYTPMHGVFDLSLSMISDLITPSLDNDGRMAVSFEVQYREPVAGNKWTTFGHILATHGTDPAIPYGLAQTEVTPPFVKGYPILASIIYPEIGSLWGFSGAGYTKKNIGGNMIGAPVTVAPGSGPGHNLIQIDTRDIPNAAQFIEVKEVL